MSEEIKLDQQANIIDQETTKSEINEKTISLEIKPLKLHFGKGNAKLDTEILTFSLPAGKTCPFAHLCKTWVTDAGNLQEKLLTNEADQNNRYRCFAASMEVRFPSYKKSVNRNLDLLSNCKNSDEMVNLIIASLPEKFDKIRIHVGGDFFCEDYFIAWNEVAKKFPEKHFYAYTKSLPYWIKHKNEISSNFVLTASYGGLFDDLILENELKHVKVYFHPDDAAEDGVEIDHDDSLAMNPDVKKFGLLIHGQQPKNSEASKAISKLKKENIKFGYKNK